MITELGYQWRGKYYTKKEFDEILADERRWRRNDLVLSVMRDYEKKNGLDKMVEFSDYVERLKNDGVFDIWKNQGIMIKSNDEIIRAFEEGAR